jgi:hypothetical protein
MRRSRKIVVRAMALVLGTAGTVYAQTQHCAYSGAYFCTPDGYYCAPMPGWMCVAVGPCKPNEQ